MSSDNFKKYQSFKKHKRKIGLHELRSRLEKGETINCRIVEILNNNKYLLRIHGYNLVTESKKKFKQGEEIKAKIKKLKPQIILSLNKKIDKYKELSSSDNNIDIIVNK